MLPLASPNSVMTCIDCNAHVYSATRCLNSFRRSGRSVGRFMRMTTCKDFPIIPRIVPFPRWLLSKSRDPQRARARAKYCLSRHSYLKWKKDEKSVKTRELLLTATSAQCHVLSSMAIARYCNLVPRMWLQIKLHVTLICVNKVMSARKIPILRRNGITCDTLGSPAHIHFLNVGSC